MKSENSSAAGCYFLLSGISSDQQVAELLQKMCKNCFVDFAGWVQILWTWYLAVTRSILIHYDQHLQQNNISTTKQKKKKKIFQPVDDKNIWVQETWKIFGDDLPEYR